jgi:hypothetical protein
MTPKDEFFQEDMLEEQLDALAQTEGQSPVTPNSLAYHSLRQFHAARAKEEVQALERVRLRFAARVSSSSTSPESQREPASSIVPLPVPAKRLRRLSRLRAITSTLAAVLVVIFLVGGFLTLLHSRQPGIGEPQLETGTWKILSSPNSSLPVNALGGIVVTSSTDAWAVGLGSSKEPVNQEIPLIEHWDGQRWQVVPTPALPYGGILSSVISLAPDNAWAVGEAYNSQTFPLNNATTQALIEHWNGHRWSVVQSSVAGSEVSSLNKLVALSANDIWAVGNYAGNIMTGGPIPLIEHWDGHHWKFISNPSTSGGGLSDIVALAPDNIWAVGGNGSQTLVEHWDGTQWRIIPSPNTGMPHNQLSGITAISANNIWAAGNTSAQYNAGNTCCFLQTLVEHWDGQQWHIVASPPTVMAMMGLSDIVALGPNDIWAIGGMWKDHTFDPVFVQGLIEHWDGQRWSLVSNPHPQGCNILGGIAVDPSVAGKLWIVGSNGPQCRELDSLSDSTLIETNT